ncbi:MAG: translation initiation factor eIF-1A [Candidatus Aenigmatarchaeota archaeon]
MNQEKQEVEERARLPKEGEVIGIVEAKLGGKRFSVRCLDGNLRICRVPGKYGTHLWIAVSDVVIVKPWPVQGDKRGDIIWKYSKAQIEWLKRNGFLK